MSVEALKWAFEQEDVPPGPRFVLVALANRSNEEGGDLYPSIAWIKRKTGIPERTIRAYIEQLQDRGLLIKTERRREDGGRTSNEYRLPLLEPTLRFAAPPAVVAGGGVQPLPGPPAVVAGHETKEQTKEIKSASLPANPQPIAKGNEGRKPRSSPPPNPLPGEIPDNVWAAFVELRRTKRAPLTDYAVRLLVGKVREIGQSPVALFELAIERGWTTVYPLKGQNFAAPADGGSGMGPWI